jgi:hypothetical protein
MELGFTLMWCLSEQSVSNHIGERHVREDENDLKNKLLQQSSSIADDDEIAVVQVGEAPRQFQQNPQNLQKKD